MDFGLCTFSTDYSISPVELAKAAEERGFESLFFAEHTHIPSSRLTPFPGGGELPKEYARCLDPFVALSAAAAATRSLRLGTGVCLVIERDPILLAKQVASLDHLSGGRVLFGVGGGWNREEMENHGTPYARRWMVLRERVEAMKEVWTKEVATYRGEFVHFEAIWSWPKPIRRPHPPVLVGGDGPGTLRRVVRYGDGWMPLARGKDSFAERIRELNDIAAKAGRAPIPVTLFGLAPEPARVERAKAEGISRVLFGIPAAGADRVLPRLDELAALARRFA